MKTIVPEPPTPRSPRGRWDERTYLYPPQRGGKPAGSSPLDTGLERSNPSRAGAGTLTCWLNTLNGVDPAAAAELVPLVYDELRRLAAIRMANEPPGQTLQATALVHEAYLRLVGSSQSRHWNSRGHFFGAAAEAMRRILIENARRKLTQKRGAGADLLDITNIELAAETEPERLLLVNEALDRLSAEDPQAAELVKLRFFAGLDGQEAAEVMGLSQRTATRLWAYARAWLFREIQAAAK